MSRRIKEMSLEKIVEIIGIPTDSKNFLEALKNIKDRKLYDETLEILRKPNGWKTLIKEDYRFDKAKFVLVTALEMQDKIKNSMMMSSEFYDRALVESYRIALENAKKLLEGEDVTVTDSDISTGRVVIKTNSSLDLIGEHQKRQHKIDRNRGRLERIRKDNPREYEQMIQNINPMDFMDLIMDDPNVGYRMISLIYANSLIKQGKLTMDEVLKGTDKYKKLANAMERKDYREEVERALYDYAEYLNIDKLLLTTISRKYVTSKSEDRDIEKMNEIKSYISTMLRYIEDSRVRISGETEGLLSDKNKTARISTIRLSDIRASMENYINGIDYSSKDTVDSIVERLLDGEMDISEFSKKEIHLILREYNKDVFMKKDERFTIAFLKAGELTRQEIKRLSEGEISNDLFLNLYMTGNMKKEDILNKYLQGEIRLEGIRKLRSELENKSELDDLVSEKDLVQAFLERKTEKERYRKLRSLYYELRIRNKRGEERKVIGEEIISQDDKTLDSLMELYKDNLITIENAIDWGGSDIAINLLKKRELTPNDTKRLYDEGIIKMEDLEDIVKDNRIKRVERLILINSTFTLPEEEDIRKRLIEKVDIEERAKSKGKKKRSGTEREEASEEDKKKTTKRSEERITDPAARWNLFRTIDSEYTDEITTDGYLKKIMPNENIVVIEPLYKSDKEVTIYASGAATFFIDRDIFEEVEDRIISPKNKVNVGFLNELYSQGDAFKITHTTSTERRKTQTWEKKVRRYFIDNSTRQRTETELQEIEEAVENISKSCRVINNGR